ncbi:hypothetical protein KAI87_07325 [Myxococcota bacterium]|nr:hypothetical protein [Myxococcota bacterium]
MTEIPLREGSHFPFWQKWMVVYSSISIVLGLVMTFGSTSILFDAYNLSVSQAFWDQANLHEAVSAYHPWIFSVLGSTITGWSVTLLFIALYPFKRRERWAYFVYIASLLMWAPLDSAFSIYFGVYTEALFNIGAVTGYAIPLIATYRDFFPKAADS